MTIKLSIPYTDAEDFAVWCIFNDVLIYTMIYKEGSFSNKRYIAFIEGTESTLKHCEKEYSVIQVIN